jgi:hypothetical protein
LALLFTSPFFPIDPWARFSTRVHGHHTWSTLDWPFFFSSLKNQPLRQNKNKKQNLCMTGDREEAATQFLTPRNNSQHETKINHINIR